MDDQFTKIKVCQSGTGPDYSCTYMTNSYLSSFLLATSHTHNFSSSPPVTSMAPFLENLHIRMLPLLLCSKMPIFSPDLTSQRMHLPSVEQEASTVPNGEKAHECTLYEWPHNGEHGASLKSSKFQSLTVLSEDDEANCSVLKATDVTSLVCEPIVWNKVARELAMLCVELQKKK